MEKKMTTEAVTIEKNTPVELDDEDLNTDLHLAFGLAGQSYALEILFISEIVGMQEITPVPDAPNYVKGVVNLRGNVIPVVDVRLRFNMPEQEYDERTCIIVTTVGDVTVGLVVDQVNEVISITEDKISPPPKVNENQVGAEYIKGLGKLDDGVSILLDVRNILDYEVIQEKGLSET